MGAPAIGWALNTAAQPVSEARNRFRANTYLTFKLKSDPRHAIPYSYQVYDFLRRADGTYAPSTATDGMDSAGAAVQPTPVNKGKMEGKNKRFGFIIVSPK
jgi:hypothetical protein